MSRNQSFITGFLNESNVDALFMKHNIAGRLSSSDRTQFRKLLEYIAEKNNLANLTTDSANKYVNTNFVELWEKWKKKTAQKSPVAQSLAPVQENFVRRRRNNEQFITNNPDARASDVMNDTVSYEFIGAKPSTDINYKQNRVPYNYNSLNDKYDEEAIDTAMNQKTRTAGAGAGTRPADSGASIVSSRQKDTLTASANDVYIGIPLNMPGRGFIAPDGSLVNDEMTNLATDGSINGMMDMNIAMKKTARDNRRAQEYILKIDSRLRNINLSKRSNSYKTSLYDQLGNEFGFMRNLSGIQNVISVELLQATIPNIIRESTTQFYEPYLFLDIAEIRGNVVTGITDPQRVFAELYYYNSDTIKDTPHLTLTPSNCSRNYHEDNPLSILKNITVTFYNFDGEIADFGEDAPAIQTITAGFPTVITTSIPHGILTGDRVYLRGVVSGDTAYDRFLNQTKGWIAATMSLNSFQIDYDSTGMPALQAPGNALIAKLQNNITLRIMAFTNDISG